MPSKDIKSGVTVDIARTSSENISEDSADIAENSELITDKLTGEDWWKKVSQQSEEVKKEALIEYLSRYLSDKNKIIQIVENEQCFNLLMHIISQFKTIDNYIINWLVSDSNKEVSSELFSSPSLFYNTLKLIITLLSTRVINNNFFQDVNSPLYKVSLWEKSSDEEITNILKIYNWLSHNAKYSVGDELTTNLSAYTELKDILEAGINLNSILNIRNNKVEGIKNANLFRDYIILDSTGKVRDFKIISLAIDSLENAELYDSSISKEEDSSDVYISVSDDGKVRLNGNVKPVPQDKKNWFSKNIKLDLNKLSDKDLKYLLQHIVNAAKNR